MSPRRRGPGGRMRPLPRASRVGAGGPGVPPRTALEDPGTTQALLFLGWIPPAVTALVGGVIVGVLTASLGTAIVVVVGGTVVGYITCLTIAFTIGWYLERRGVGERVANAFVWLDLLSGVPVAMAIAVLAWIAVPGPCWRLPLLSAG